MASQIYMDHAAATPVSSEVLTSMQPYFSELFYNPSATYVAATEIKKDLEAARANVAQVLGAKPGEIIFTAGGTEANNLAIHGIMEQFPDGNVVVSAIEHDSVLAPAQHYDYKLAPVSPDGIVDLERLTNLIDDHTVLVSVMYVNNEIGTIQPLKQLAEKLDEIHDMRRKAGNKRPLYFHTDAAQAGNYLDLHVSRLGIDLMTLNGGKIYGPKASGALYSAARVKLQPQILGGGQERGLRSGTENVPASVGFAEALAQTQDKRHEEVKRLQALQKLFIELLQEKIPSTVINGHHKQRLPNNVHVTFPGHDNERLIFALDDKGIQAAAGSACSASHEEPSHVLRACGLSDAEARASLRFTLGRETTEADVRKVAAALANLVA